MQAQIPAWKSWLHRAAGRALGTVPELGAARLEAESRKFGPAAIPQIFSRELRRLDPTFNEELLEIAGRAELALRNRFSFLNQTQDFGQQIRWESVPSGAWKAELHSFDFALDLAIMFRVSGEERYARRLRYLVADWIASNPPLEGTGWAIVPLARRFRNWVLVSDLGRIAWQADVEFAQVASRSLALQAICLERAARAPGELTEHAHIAVALLLSSMVFSSSRSATHRERAIETLRGAVARAFDSHGCREPSPSARVRLARAILEFILFEPAFDEPTSQWLKQSLERTLRSVEEILLPDGTAPAFGISAPPNPDTLNDLFAAAAAVLGAEWAKSAGDAFGVLPMLLLGPAGQERYTQIPFVDWSLSQTADSPAGLFRITGPAKSAAVVSAGSAHSGHQDFLSYELMLRGMRVIVDSGAWTPAGEGGDDYFAGAAAHNVLLLEERLGALREEEKCTAEISSAAEFTRLRVQVPGEFGRERIWFALADGSWIVLDRLARRGPHLLQSLIHFFPTFEITLQNGFALSKSLSMAVSVIPFGNSPPRMATGRGENANLAGWYSPDYGIRFPSSVLAFEWDIAADLSPSPTGKSKPGKDWTGGYMILPGSAGEVRPIEIVVETDMLLLDTSVVTRRLPLGNL